MDAVGDYIKTHGDENGDLTLKEQLQHLKVQKESLKRWKSTLAKMGVMLEDEWIDESMSDFSTNREVL